MKISAQDLMNYHGELLTDGNKENIKRFDKSFKESYRDTGFLLPDINVFAERANKKRGDLESERELGRLYSFYAQYGWNFNKNEYEIDPTLFKNLIETKADILLPESLVDKLPYINTLINFPFSVHLTDVTQEEGTDFDACMFILIKYSDDIKVLFGITMTVKNNEYYHTSMRIPCINGFYGTNGSEATERYVHKKNILLAILSYLISKTCEYHPTTPYQGFNLSERTVKGERRLFKSTKIMHHKLGFAMGEQIRKFENDVKEKGVGKCPHIRRAHFHGYWKGPRNGDQEFELKWIAPTFINHVDTATQ